MLTLTHLTDLSATRGSSVAGGLLSQQEKLSKSMSSRDKVSPDKQTASKQGPPGDFRGSLGNISSSLDERGLRERDYAILALVLVLACLISLTGW